MTKKYQYENHPLFQSLSQWANSSDPNLEASCDALCDLDGFVPEAILDFWNTIENKFEETLRGAMADIENDIINQLHIMREENREIMKQAVIRPADCLWSLDELVEFYKLPLETVVKIVRDPRHPPCTPIKIETDHGDEMHYRWFAEDVISHTRGLRFPRPPARRPNPPRESYIDTGDLPESYDCPETY